MLKVSELKHNEILPRDLIRSQFPDDVYQVLVDISREGFALTLVGGAVRDLLRTNKLGRDFDFELHHIFEYGEEDWSFRVKRLGERLASLYHYKVEFLSFSILRIYVGGDTVEVAPARLESFSGKGPFGHSDFQVQLVSKADYRESFKRRDFTINAMGIELGPIGTKDEFKLVDPFNGLGDIQAKYLRPCSESFYYDPVRFLRMIRFCLAMGFRPAPELELGRFNLLKMTKYYFLKEAFKSQFFPFVRLFFKLTDENNIELPQECLELISLCSVDFCIKDLKVDTLEKVLIYLIYGPAAWSIDQIDNFSSLVSMKKGLGHKYIQLRGPLELLSSLKWQDLVKGLQTMPIEAFLVNEKVLALSQVRQAIFKKTLKEWSFLKEMLPHYGDVLQSIEKTFPEFLLGEEGFDKLIRENSYTPQDRGPLKLYCHLQELAL